MKSILLAVVGLALSPAAAFAQSGTWTSRAAVPAAGAEDRGGRSEHAAAGFGGRVYVFGGWTDALWWGRVTDTGVYDPVADSWTMAAAPGTWRSQAGAAVSGGRILLVGGFGENYLATPVCESFDPSAGTWRVEDSLDYARGMVGVAAVGTRIHAVGGLRNGSTVREHEVFDPSTGVWAPAAPFPLASGISGPAAVGLDGLLHILGGFVNFVGVSAEARAYDPVTDAWSSPVSLGSLGRGVSVAAVGRRIYAFGGERNTQVIGYRPSTGEVITGLASMSPGRTSQTSVTAGTCVYVMGGEDDGGYRLNLNEEFRPPPFGDVPVISNLRQRRDGVDVPQGGLTGAPLELVATVEDPDGLLEIVEFEVRPAGDLFTGEPTQVAAGPVGAISCSLTSPAPGDYKWRARVIDDEDNVSEWIDFGTNGGSGADFRIDADPPSVPEPLYPDGGAALEDRRVRLVWTSSSDSSGISGYRVQVSTDPLFGAPVADLLVPGTEAVVGVPDGTLYWRVLARDNSGLESPWSRLAMFRVLDATDHGAGDAKRVCGFGSPGTSASGWLAVLLLSIAGAVWRGAR